MGMYDNDPNGSPDPNDWNYNPTYYASSAGQQSQQNQATGVSPNYYLAAQGVQPTPPAPTSTSLAQTLASQQPAGAAPGSYMYQDPSGHGFWIVQPGETPATAAANPSNPANNINTTIGSGVGQGQPSINTLFQALTQNPSQTPSNPGGLGLSQPTQYTNSFAVPPPDTGPESLNGFRIPFRGPNGEYKYTKDMSEMDQLMQQGWKPVHPEDGTEINVEQFAGGYLFDGLPINTVLTGTMSEAQRTALINGGRWNSAWDPGGSAPITISGAGGSTGNNPPTQPPTPPPTGGGGGGPTHPAQTGYFGDPNVTAPPLPGKFEDLLKELMQRSLNQGAQGQQAFAGVLDDLKNYLGFARAGAEQSYNTRNALAQDLLGRLNPAIDTALANMNTATGLSPEAMAALRLNAIEGPEAAYQGQASQLKSMLGQRGAYGGETPGSMGDIVRGYAPLLTARDSTRSGLLANTILADEQRKFDTLGLNRQTGLGALGAGGGLLSTIGNIYNPSPFLGANESALSGLLSGTNAYNQTGFQGLNTAGGLAGILGDQQAGSFSNLLKSALIGTGVNIAGNLDWGKIIGGIVDIFKRDEHLNNFTGGDPNYWDDWNNFKTFRPPRLE